MNEAGSIKIAVDMDDVDLEKQLKEFHKTIEQTMEKVKNSFSSAILPVEKLEEAQKKLTENIAQSKKDIDSYAESISKSKTAYDESKIKLDEYAKKVKEAQTAFDELKPKVDELKKAMQEKNIVVKANIEETKNLKKQYEELKEKEGEEAETTKKAKEAYETLNQTLSKNKEELKSAKKEYTDANTQFKESKTALTEANSAYKDQETAVKSLDREVKFFTHTQETEQKHLENLEESLKKTNEMIEKNSNSWNVWSKSFSNIEDITKPMGESLQQVGKSMSTYITAPLTALGTLSAKAAIDFESALAGVKKTVEATEEEFAALESGIREMAKTLPASAVEIAGVAEAAGQLGIQKENILEFTKVMIDLGESTNLSANEAATSFARFANIVGMSQSDFDKLGSVIVDLGNNFATTESEIVAMGTRLAGAGKQIGLAESEIMAFAAALSSVGIEAEMGGSAISKLMIQMKVAAETGNTAQTVIEKTGMSLRKLELFADADGLAFKDLAQSMNMTSAELKDIMSSAKDLENFSKVTGMTADEFQRAFGEDAAQTLNKFFTGLGQMESKGQSAIVVLDEMGISETRLRDSILRASNAQDLFTNAIDVGQQAWESNTALTEEANKRYETLASRIDVAKNSLSDIGITVGEVLMPHLEKAIEGVGKFADWFSTLNDSTVETALKIGAVALAIGPVVGTIGSLLTTVGTVSGALSVMSGAMAVSTGAAITATPAMIGLAGGITAVGTAIEVLKGPVGWITLGIVGVVTAVKLWTNAQEKHREELEKERQALIHSGDTFKTLGNQIDETTSKSNNLKILADNYEELNTAIKSGKLDTDELKKAKEKLASIEQQLISISDGLITQYDIEHGTFDQRLRILQNVTEAERNLAILRAEQELETKYAEDYTEALEKQAETLEKLNKRQQELNDIYEISTGKNDTYKRSIEEVIAVTRADTENWEDRIQRGARYIATLSDEEKAELKRISTKELFSKALNEAIELEENYRTELEKVKEEIIITTAKINDLTISEAERAALETRLASLEYDAAAAQEKYNKILEEGTNATNDNTASTETLTTAYESLLTTISNVVKESSKLQSAYQTLRQGEQLSAETLLDLIDKYPIVAQYIAETNDLTLDKGRILKEVLAAEKEFNIKNQEIEQKRLEDEIEMAKARIAVAENEYAQKEAAAKRFYEVISGIPGVTISGLDISRDEIDAENEALEKLNQQLADLKAKMQALDTIELTYTATKKASSSATKKATEDTKKLTEVTEEYLMAVTSVIEDAEGKIQQELEGTTLATVKALEEQQKAEQEAADRKVQINKIALKRMEADNAESAEKRAELEKEYLDLVSEYNTKYLKDQTAERKKSLEEQQKAYEELEEKVMESLKARNEEMLEIEQYLLDRQIQANKEATDEIIKEYQRQYDEKIKLIDEASQAEIRALQSQLDALDEQDQTDKAYANLKKLNELNQAVMKARTGDGDLAKALEAYNKEVERQAQERKDAETKARRESLKAEIEGLEEANKQKAQLTKDAQEASAKARDEEIAYYQKVADMEVEIAGTKNEQLKQLLQEDLDNYKQAHDEKAALVKGDTAYLQFDKTIEQLEKQLGEARTDAEKARIQKQLDEIQSFKDEFFNNVTLMDQQAKNLIEQAQEEIHLNKMKEIRKQQYAEMNTTENLEAEARLLMVQGNEDAVIALLSKYNDDWKQQGKDHAVSYSDSIKEEFADLTAYVKETMDTISKIAVKTETSKDTGLVEALKKDLSESEQYIPKYRSLGEMLADAFKAGFSTIQTMMAEMITNAAKTMSSGTNTVITIIRTGNDEIIEVFEEYKPKWKESGISLIDNILEGADFNRLLDKARKAMEEMRKIISGEEEIAEMNYTEAGQLIAAQASSHARGPIDIEAVIQLQAEQSRLKYGDAGVGAGGVNIESTFNFYEPIKYPSDVARATNEANQLLAEKVGVLA